MHPLHYIIIGLSISGIVTYLIGKFIKFTENKCECGGKFIAWSDKKSFCEKCGEVE